MDRDKWVCVLLEWVNCLKLGPHIVGIEQLKSGEFLVNLQKLLSRSSEVATDPLTYFFEKFTNHYPHIQFENQTEINLCDFSNSQLILFTSLLMHYTCIYDRRDVLTSPLCHYVTSQSQIIIRNYLEKFDTNFTISKLNELIEQCVNEELIVRQKKEWSSESSHNPSSPLQAFLKTPISKTIKLQEKDRIIAQLKSELELERCEKIDLQEEVRLHTESRSKLEQELNIKVHQVSALRNEIAALESRTPPHYQEKNSQEIQRRLKSEINSLEVYVQQLEQEQEELRKQCETTSEKLRVLESKCTLWREKFVEVERKYELQTIDFKNKTQEAQYFEQHCSELTAILEEYKTKEMNETSVMEEVTFENLGTAVIEVQLKEAQKQNEEYKERIEELEKTKTRQQNEIAEISAQFNTVSRRCQLLTYEIEDYAKKIGLLEDNNLVQKNLRQKAEHNFRTLEKEFDKLRIDFQTTQNELVATLKLNDELKENLHKSDAEFYKNSLEFASKIRAVEEELAENSLKFENRASEFEQRIQVLKNNCENLTQNLQTKEAKLNFQESLFQEITQKYENENKSLKEEVGKFSLKILDNEKYIGEIQREYHTVKLEFKRSEDHNRELAQKYNVCQQLLEESEKQISELKKGEVVLKDEILQNLEQLERREKTCEALNKKLQVLKTTNAEFKQQILEYNEKIVAKETELFDAQQAAKYANQQLKEEQIKLMLLTEEYQTKMMKQLEQQELINTKSLNQIVQLEKCSQEIIVIKEKMIQQSSSLQGVTKEYEDLKQSSSKIIEDLKKDLRKSEENKQNLEDEKGNLLCMNVDLQKKLHENEEEVRKQLKEKEDNSKKFQNVELDLAKKIGELSSQLRDKEDSIFTLKDLSTNLNEKNKELRRKLNELEAFSREKCNDLIMLRNGYERDRSEAEKCYAELLDTTRELTQQNNDLKMKLDDSVHVSYEKEREAADLQQKYNQCLNKLNEEKMKLLLVEKEKEEEILKLTETILNYQQKERDFANNKTENEELILSLNKEIGQFEEKQKENEKLLNNIAGDYKRKVEELDKVYQQRNAIIAELEENCKRLEEIEENNKHYKIELENIVQLYKSKEKEFDDLEQQYKEATISLKNKITIVKDFQKENLELSEKLEEALKINNMKDEEIIQLESEKSKIELDLSNSQQFVNQLEDEIKQKELQIKNRKEENEELAEIVKAMNKEIEKTANELIAKQKHILEMQEKIKSLEELVGTLKTIEADYKQIVCEAEEKKTENARLRDELLESEKLQQITVQKKEEIEEKLLVVEKEQNETINNLEKILKENTNLQQQIDEINLQVENKNCELMELQKQEQELKIELANKEKLLGETAQQLEENRGECNALNLNFIDLKTELKRIEKLNEELSRKLEEKNVDLKNVIDEKTLIESNLQEAQNMLESSIQENLQKLNEHEQRIEDFQGKLNTYITEIKQLQQLNDELNATIQQRNSEIELLQKEKNAVNNSYTKIEEQFNNKQIGFESLQNENEKLNDDLGKIKEEKDFLKGQSHELIDLLAKAEADLLAAQKQQKQIVYEFDDFKFVNKKREDELEEMKKKNEELDLLIKKKDLELVALKQDYNDVNRQLSALEQTSTEATDDLRIALQDSATKCNLLEVETNTLKSNLNKLQEQYDEANTKVEVKKKKLREEELKRDLLEDKSRGLLTKVDKLNEENTHLIETKTNLQNNIDDLKQLNDVLKEKIVNDEFEIGKLQQTIEDYEITISGLKTVVDSNLELISNLRSGKEELIDKINKNGQIIDELRSALEQSEGDKDAILDSLKTLRRNQFNLDANFEKTQNELSLAKKENEQLNLSLNSLRKDKHDLTDQLEKTKEELKYNESVRLEIIAALTKALNKNNILIEETLSANFLKKLEDVISDITEKSEIADNLNESLSKIQNLLGGKATPLNVNGICEKIMELLAEKQRLEHSLKLEKSKPQKENNLNNANKINEDDLKKKNSMLRNKLVLVENSKQNLEKTLKKLREDNQKLVLESKTTTDEHYKALLQEHRQYKEDFEKMKKFEENRYEELRKEYENYKKETGWDELEKLRDAYGKVMEMQQKLNLENSTLRKLLDEKNSQLIEMSLIKEAYEKLLEENNKLVTELDTIKYKRMRDKEEFVRLLKKEKESSGVQGRIMEVRAEYESKLEKMKDKMLKLYREEVNKEVLKVKSNMYDNTSLMKDLSTIRSELFDAKQKGHFLEMENEILKRQLESVNYYASRESLPQNQKTTDVRFKSATLPRTAEYLEEITISRRCSINSMGRNLQMEDEDDDFNNKYLEDLKEGRCHVPAITNGVQRNPNERMSELVWRNSMVPPHLKSSYPVELQCFSPSKFKEEDIKTGHMEFENSLCKLLPKESRDPRDSHQPRKKDFGTTSYKRPGPPTPSKNGGRLSLQSNELHPHGVAADTSKTPKRITPSRLRSLFMNIKNNSVKDSGESITTPTGKGGRLNIFRKPK